MKYYIKNHPVLFHHYEKKDNAEESEYEEVEIEVTDDEIEEVPEKKA